MKNKRPTSQPADSKTATTPTLIDLVTFCRVVDLGSMTAAAQALGESKGTVSRRMSRLEQTLGTALLSRQGRRVSPTDEGLAYRERVGVAVEVIEEAGAMLRAAHDAPAGTLRVTASPGTGSALLSSMLPGFLRAYPSVAVEIVLTNEVLSFREQNIDVALRLAARLPDSSLVARKLLAIEPILVASPTYLAERGTPSEPSDLAAHDHLAVPVPTSHPPMLEKENGGDVRTVTFRGRVLTHDDHLLRDLAVAGCGITAVIPQFARDNLESGRLVRVLPDWKLTYSANLYLIHAGGVLAPKTRAFRDFMFAFLAGDDCP